MGRDETCRHIPTRADTWEEGPCVGLGKLRTQNLQQASRARDEAMLNRNLVAHGTWQTSWWRRVHLGRDGCVAAERAE